MNAKEFLKQFIPPIVLSLYRRITRRAYVWEGVYASFKDVPLAGPGFNGDALAVPTVAYTQEAIRSATGNKAIAPDVINDYALLAQLASVARQRSGNLKVLDFGGGVGINYVHLLSGLGEVPALDYHIVELEWACRAGPRLYPGDGRIHFHRTLPEALPDLNILYMSGVLPYIEDYAGLLRTLCAYRAEYFLISDLPAGAFATYASAQKNVRGTLMPSWFFNANEILEIMRQQGYALICKGATEQVYNQDNFPADRRLERGRASQFLFSRL